THRWRGMNSNLGSSGAKPKPLPRGTGSSNPVLSSAESCEPQSLGEGKTEGRTARMQDFELNGFLHQGSAGGSLLALRAKLSTADGASMMLRGLHTDGLFHLGDDTWMQRSERRY